MVGDGCAGWPGAGGLARAGTVLARLVVMAGLVIVGLPERAAAESDAVCRQYAQSAVAAFREARSRGCRLASTRWQDDSNAHYTWCRGQPSGFVTAETRARGNELLVCRGDPQAVQCKNYAMLAVSEQISNLAGHCGFTGSRWQDNLDSHLAWCLGVSVEAAQHEIDIRIAMLGTCARIEPYVRCDGYARRAVAQATEAQQRGCLFGGQPAGRWSATYEDHLAWCISQPADVSNRETSQREGPLSQCRTTNPIGATTPAPEACTVTARLINRACLNADGTGSSIVPGSLSAVGCGGADAAATLRAKLNFTANVSCLSDGSTPAPGCCTYSVSTTPGCGCR